MTDLEDRVNSLLKIWNRYCIIKSYSSISSEYIFEDARSKQELYPVHELIAMGKPALPFIYNAYTSKDPKLVYQPFLGYVVRKITGDEIKIPERLRGRINKIIEYETDWLYFYLRSNGLLDGKQKKS